MGQIETYETQTATATEGGMGTQTSIKLHRIFMPELKGYDAINNRAARRRQKRRK